jgi:antitoxin component of MazEF toxin-antitoxin module
MLIDLIEEDGDVIMPLPDDICKEMNIGPGTELEFKPQPDGSIVMKRKHELKTFAVETVSVFRHVYFVKAESAEHAMDEVTCNDGNMNYFQKHVEESILSAREVSKAGMVQLIRETEQPDMTLEQLETGKWLQNCVNVIDYTK